MIERISALGERIVLACAHLIAAVHRMIKRPPMRERQARR